MGSLKLEQTSRLQEAKTEGENVKETGEQKVQEAAESNDALGRIEAIDEDDQGALENAYDAANTIATEIAHEQVETPGNEVNENLAETAETSREYAETEARDAQTAQEVTSDYASVGNSLASSLEQSEQFFTENAEQSEQTSSELQAAFDAIINQLEGTFTG